MCHRIQFSHVFIAPLLTAAHHYDHTSQLQQPMPHPAFVKGYPDAPAQLLLPGPQLETGVIFWPILGA